jgi:hypothetical protein
LFYWLLEEHRFLFVVLSSQASGLQEDLKFKASLNYKATSYLKGKKKNQNLGVTRVEASL